MSSRPDIGRLRRIPRAELVRMLAENPVPDPWRFVQELREAAVPFYSTDAAEARAIAARAVELAEILRDDRSRGWGYRALAEALAYSGRIRESEDAYQKATAALRRAQDGPTLGQLLVGRIQVLALLGRHDAVRRLAAEARHHLQEANDDPYLARLSVSLGNVHFQHDDYDGALTEFDRALALLPVRDELAISLGLNRAFALVNLGREEEGIEIYEQLETECRDRFGLLEAQIQMNAAHVHVQRGEFDRALARLAPAARYFRHTGHPTFLATSQLHRAEAYQQMNLRREALELAEEAAQIFRAEGLGYDEALAHGQVAIAQIAMGRPAEASRRLRRGRRLFEKEQNPSRVALTRLLWAESLFQRGQLRRATLHVEAALETFRKLRLVRWEAAATVLRTRIALQKSTRGGGARGGLRPRGSIPQDHVAALRKLTRRLAPAIYPLQTYRLLEALGETLERDGKIHEAERSYRSAIRCLEDLRLRVPTEDSKIAFLEDKIHLYDRLLTIELGAKTPSVERLFEWMERSRAQSLWDRLSAGSASAANASDPSDLDKLRRHIYWLHARVSQLELGKDQERAQADALRKQLIEVEGEWTRRLRETRESEPVDGRDSKSDGVGEPHLLALDPRQLRDSLPKGWGYLSYHVGRDFAIAVALTATEIRYCRLDPELGRKLLRLCARLDFQWGAAALSSVRNGMRAFPNGNGHAQIAHGKRSTNIRPDISGGTRNGSLPGNAESLVGPRAHSDLLVRTTHGVLAEMHELLWAPLERLGLGGVRGWVVSPHGPIHRVPIHALRGPEGFVVERFDLSLTPSARIWRKLAERGRSNEGGDRIWIGGVPSPHLPAVALELDQVARILAELDPATVTAPTAQMFRDQTHRARLIHLAAHGSLRRDNPAFSFIQMADGPLFVHDLVDLDLTGSQVVLTACSSGRAGAPVGDEWIGLARGFLQAGAASVVASLWPIEDGPTHELMGLYYGRLAQGDPPALALGAAMRKFMTLRPHPWHWAPFAVLGGLTVDPAQENTPHAAGSRKRGHL